MKPLISVIVPVYNVEKYLGECLDTLVGQSYPNLQIIVVDDGSTDRSGIICDEYAQRDKRIQVVHQPNGGLSAARNAGMALATGEYISFVDSDDYVDADFYRTCLQEIGDHDVLAFGYKKVSDSKQCLQERVLPLSEDSVFVLVTAWTKLFRRDFLQRNHLQFAVGYLFEDTIFSFDWWTSEPAPRVKVSAYTGYNYRVNQQSITNTVYKKPLNTTMVFACLRDRSIHYSDGAGRKSAPWSYVLNKLNLYLLSQKAAAVSYASFQAEWQANQQIVDEIIATKHWRKSCWLRVEKLSTNLTVCLLHIMRKIKMEKLVLRLVYRWHHGCMK